MFLLVSALIYLATSLMVVAAVDIVVGWIYMPASSVPTTGLKPITFIKAATSRIRL